MRRRPGSPVSAAIAVDGLLQCVGRWLVLRQRVHPLLRDRCCSGVSVLARSGDASQSPQPGGSLGELQVV